MLEGQKTHNLVKIPSLNVRYLADYMAASEQLRRSILRSCKYRPIARMIQHIEAKNVVSNYIKSGNNDPDVLKEKAKKIKERLAVDQFEEDTNKHNAGYVERFSQVVSGIVLPACEIQFAGKFIDFPLNGISVRLDPPLSLIRTTKTNKIKRGALMLRYQKDKPLAEAVADFQSAAMLGLLKMIYADDGTEPEGALCITLDAQSGRVYPAPGKAVYLFKEIQAACQSIAERWEAIAPPPKAIF